MSVQVWRRGEGGGHLTARCYTYILVSFYNSLVTTQLCQKQCYTYIKLLSRISFQTTRRAFFFFNNTIPSLLGLQMTCICMHFTSTRSHLRQLQQQHGRIQPCLQSQKNTASTQSLIFRYMHDIETHTTKGYLRATGACWLVRIQYCCITSLHSQGQECGRVKTIFH